MRQFTLNDVQSIFVTINAFFKILTSTISNTVLYITSVTVIIIYLYLNNTDKFIEIYLVVLDCYCNVHCCNVHCCMAVVPSGEMFQQHSHEEMSEEARAFLRSLTKCLDDLDTLKEEASSAVAAAANYELPRVHFLL